MKLDQYQAEAQNTKSDKFYGNTVDRDIFISDMQRAIEALKQLDFIKKALFYNKTNPFKLPVDERKLNCFALQVNHLDNIPQNGIDLIHGIIGKATEAGELLEALLGALTNPHKLDTVNVLEEVGDGLWYDAIILQAIGGSFERCAQINNEKLRARFPNKFTEADAVNRDLDKERKILETGEGALGKSHNIGFEIDACADLDD